MKVARGSFSPTRPAPILRRCRRSWTASVRPWPSSASPGGKPFGRHRHMLLPSMRLWELSCTRRPRQSRWRSSLARRQAMSRLLIKTSERMSSWNRRRSSSSGSVSKTISWNLSQSEQDLPSPEKATRARISVKPCRRPWMASSGRFELRAGAAARALAREAAASGLGASHAAANAAQAEAEQMQQQIAAERDAGEKLLAGGHSIAGAAALPYQG